jgi:hypothetical protein
MTALADVAAPARPRLLALHTGYPVAFVLVAAVLAAAVLPAVLPAVTRARAAARSD